jgi:predicted PurR-regulated permease PerM
LLIPPILFEISNFINALPEYITSAAKNLGIISTRAQLDDFNRELVIFFRDRLGYFAQGAYSVTVNIFSATLGLVSILVFSFYLMLEKEKLEETLVRKFPFIHSRQRRDLIEIINQIEIKLGAWARGQAALCLIIGLVTFIGLTIIRVPYALPLAFIAGILEIVPIIGPIISAIPTILVVLSADFLEQPYKPLFVIFLYALIQQLENSLIVPQVMKRAVGFSPIISILAIMIGGSLLGIAGALLAIPFLATVLAILEYYTHKHVSKQ